MIQQVIKVKIQEICQYFLANNNVKIYNGAKLFGYGQMAQDVIFGLLDVQYTKQLEQVHNTAQS